MEVDFINDWKDMISEEMIMAGYQFPNSISVRELTIKYYNILNRRVDSIPRQVVKSDVFACPTDCEPGLVNLLKKFEMGEDITPHLSKKIKEIEYDDPLLNDWSIHHFHLGALSSGSEFVSRTEPLLFARITSDSIYCINVYSHGAWSKQEIVEIIHRNWPETIEQFRAKNVVGLEYKPTDEDIDKFRKAGIVTMIQVPDGSVYAPLGGGYMTDGSSTSVIMQTNRMLRTLEHLQKYLIEEFPNIIKTHEKSSNALIAPFRCKLAFEEYAIYAIEQTNQLAIKLMVIKR